MYTETHNSLKKLTELSLLFSLFLSSECGGNTFDKISAKFVPESKPLALSLETPISSEKNQFYYYWLFSRIRDTFFTIKTQGFSKKILLYTYVLREQMHKKRLWDNTQLVEHHCISYFYRFLDETVVLFLCDSTNTCHQHHNSQAHPILHHVLHLDKVLIFIWKQCSD